MGIAGRAAAAAEEDPDVDVTDIPVVEELVVPSRKPCIFFVKSKCINALCRHFK